MYNFSGSQHLNIKDMEQSGRQTKHFSITINMQAGFYPSTFFYSRFSPKIWFLQHLFSSMAPWGGPMVDVEEKMFEIQVCRLRENPFSRIFMGILKIIHTCFCMRVCKYLNQRVRRRGKQVRNSFKGASKTKKKKKHVEIEFHNSIQDGVFTTIYWLWKSAWKNAWQEPFNRSAQFIKSFVRYT